MHGIRNKQHLYLMAHVLNENPYRMIDIHISWDSVKLLVMQGTNWLARQHMRITAHYNRLPAMF
jgi:hypothetical protein